MTTITSSAEYAVFRSTIPQKKIVVDEDDTKEWILYDSGPRHIKCPLVCLPPCSGSADIFFRQLMGLSKLGFRVIALQNPVYWTVSEWCEGFRKLLDYLGLDKVHILGASLGGFLAQKFVEHTLNCPRVESLILCNSFCDTSVFQYTDTAFLFWLLPTVVLKKLVMGVVPRKPLEADIAESMDFMVDKLNGLNQQELASRLTLNCSNCYVQPHKLQHIPMTVIDVFDECALTQQVRDNLYKSYPVAKLAHLKSGGNFPYLSRPDEFNLHLQVHLRKFAATRFSACGKLSLKTMPTSFREDDEIFPNNSSAISCTNDL
ncbi:hypothetical protein CHUAL_009045 [Chamberlinius hualienensis]